MIIDGKDLVLGRLASFVAKQLLGGEQVIIVNAAQVVISGRREATFDAYDAWLETRNLANPRKGPFHFRHPEELVRRAVRGMLPFDKSRGRTAFRHLCVYKGIPRELSGKEMISISEASLAHLGTRRFMRLEQLSKHMGVRT